MAWLKQIYKQVGIRGISALLALLLALPLGWEGLTGFYSWLSPFLMLNSVIALRSVVFLNLLGFVILALVLIKKRWFCNKLCPVGFAYDYISTCSPYKTSVVKRIPSLGKWLATISLAGAIIGLPLLVFLDPISIFNGFFGAFVQPTSAIVIVSLAGFPVLLLVHLFLPSVWCSKLCPLGGFQDGIYQIKKKIESIFNKETNVTKTVFSERRLFLFSGLGMIAGIFIPKILKGNSTSFIRPPGSVEKNLFNFLCTRCGSCIKSCPSKILVHRKDIDDAVSWMTPEVSFKNSYCIEDCNLCSQVCPSGAITLFDVAAKNILKIGVAEVLPHDCLLTQNKECDRCKAVCKYEAIKIGALDEYDAIPIIDHDKCTGCGACFVVCPTETIIINSLQ